MGKAKTFRSPRSKYTMITKTYWKSMMRKFSWILLIVLLAFSVYAEDEDLLVVGSAEELKGVTAKKIIWKKDGAKMVPIPASDTTKPFWMDATEVTVGQFKQFVKQSGYEYHPQGFFTYPGSPQKFVVGELAPNPLSGSGELPTIEITEFTGEVDWSRLDAVSPSDQHPMIYITWHDAMAYAKWTGKRLPTQKEWRFAAKGRLVGKPFTWGDDQSLARNYANYKGTGGKDEWDKSPAPVGSFKPNGYGLFDMAGNVKEWCQDWLDNNEKINKVLMGGGWTSDRPFLRVFTRILTAPNSRFSENGFRCCVSDLP